MRKTKIDDNGSRPPTRAPTAEDPREFHIPILNKFRGLRRRLVGPSNPQPQEGGDVGGGDAEDERPELSLSHGGLIFTKFHDYLPTRDKPLPRLLGNPPAYRPLPQDESEDQNLSRSSLRKHASNDSALGLKMAHSSKPLHSKKSSLPNLTLKFDQRVDVSVIKSSSDEPFLSSKEISAEVSGSPRIQRSLPSFFPEEQDEDDSNAMQAPSAASLDRLKSLYAWSDTQMGSYPKESIIIEPRAALLQRKSSSPPEDLDEPIDSTLTLLQPPSEFPLEEMSREETPEETMLKPRDEKSKIKLKHGPREPVTVDRTPVRVKYAEVVPRYTEDSKFWVKCRSKFMGEATEASETKKLWPPDSLHEPRQDFLLNNALAVFRQPRKVVIPKYQDHATGKSNNWCNSGLARNYIYKPDYGKVPAYLSARRKPVTPTSTRDMDIILELCRNSVENSISKDNSYTTSYSSYGSFYNNSQSTSKS